ncbi:MAG: class I SAM-dependent methyltransferase [Chthoniobacteraceae bacterium]
MDRFYQTTEEYAAFQHPNEMPEQWPYVRAAIEETLRRKTVCRVLEIGAGRSNFARFLGPDLRGAIHYTTQDVTRSNEDHLRGVADAVHFGSVLELDGPFDVIFSTFVLEHISDPRRTLAKLFEMLADQGRLFVFCPRYDAPFYLSHSADHYGPARRVAIGLTLLAARAWALVTRRPLFLIHTDPAIFHIDWDRDRDAIHWASLWDLELFFKKRARLEILKLHSMGVKDWIVKNLLQINLCISKPGTPPLLAR